MADKPAIGKQGKRYSAEEKAEIFSFVRAFDAENKRGGMKAASDKYGVSVVTLSNWKKNSKGPKKRKTQAKAKKAAIQKPAKTTPTSGKLAAGTLEAILDRLQEIRSEIHTLEKEFDGLKKKL